MTRIVPLHRPVTRAFLACVVLLALLAVKYRLPETRVGKEMCNGIFADKVELHVDGSATVYALNGAVIRIDHPECAQLIELPHVGSGPEIQE